MNAKPLTLEERRLRLALRCELDRLRLRLALRPSRRREMRIGGVPISTINKAFSFAQFLPGKLGRLARGVSFGVDLFRALNPFAHSP